MSVAYKSGVTSRKRQALRSNKQAISGSNSPKGDRVVPIPTAKKPLWLLRLSSAQRRSSAIAFCLIAAMLAIYGGTVYSQRTWNQGRDKLETLQRRERQLTTTTEVLKNQLAQQVEQPNTELVPPDASKTIFLEAAPQRPSRTAETLIFTSDQSQPVNPLPIGY